MYQETGCFDPAAMVDAAETDGIGISQSSLVGGDLHHHLSFSSAPAEIMEAADHHQQFLEASHHHHHHHQHHLMQQQQQQQQVSNWDTADHCIQQAAMHYQAAADPHQQQLNTLLSSSSPSQDAALYPPTPDLLNFFQLPRCPLLPNSSTSFDTTPGPSSLLYDPLLHLNLPLQPPLCKELLHSLPHAYGLPNPFAGSGSLFDDDRETSGLVFEQEDEGAGVLEFTRKIAMAGISKRRASGKATKHFATERDRRVHLNDKYNALKKMVPNPTKSDRASIVGDAIDYIQELLRTVDELKLQVEKKRWSKQRIKRHKTEGEPAGDIENKPVNDPDQCYNSLLRSSWVQRKSKDTEVDVRIIDDEVTIKLVQRKKINCLLLVSRVLDDLQLELHHVAGGHIGDYCSFLFNTKIFEDSSVYAGAIANKLIQVVDRQYAVVQPGSNY